MSRRIRSPLSGASQQELAVLRQLVHVVASWERSVAAGTYTPLPSATSVNAHLSSDLGAAYRRLERESIARLDAQGLWDDVRAAHTARFPDYLMEAKL